MVYINIYVCIYIYVTRHRGTYTEINILKFHIRLAVQYVIIVRGSEISCTKTVDFFANHSLYKNYFTLLDALIITLEILVYLF